MPTAIPYAQLCFPTLPMAVAALAERVEPLAARLDIPLEQWDEDGLGPATGFAVRLPSGGALLVQELAHAVEHLGQTGPDLLVDAGDLGAHGVAPLLGEAIAALGLDPAAVSWVQAPDVEGHARQQAAWAHAYLAARAAGAPAPPPPSL